MVSIQTNGFSFMWWGFCLFYTMQVNEILFSLLITLHQDIHRILYRTHRDQFSVELLSIKKRKNEIKMWPRVLWIIHSDGKDVLLSSALNVFFVFCFLKLWALQTKFPFNIYSNDCTGLIKLSHNLDKCVQSEQVRKLTDWCENYKMRSTQDQI